LTYNIQRWSVSGEEFSKLLDEVDPDFAAVQECAPNRWKIPPKWHVRRARTSIVVSRYPIVRYEISERKPDVNGLYCVVETPAGPIGFACVDLLTPRRALATVLDSKKVFDLTQIDNAQRRIDQRWQESEDLNKWLSGFSEPRIIGGDFNLTVDSAIYRDSWSRYQNAFSLTEFGYGHTKRTKINVFRYTSRIDHILSTPQFLPTRCRVGRDLGSDHLPLIADFVMK
jgi:endonuclease/exonuclease/phosphatase family metal-dependent hydrolase